jgi:integrase
MPSVTELASSDMCARHGLRQTALTWMADAGIELHIVQRLAGHQDPAVTARFTRICRHVGRWERVFSLVVRNWSGAAAAQSHRRH